MEHLFEYLIGGNKIGKLKKEPKTFGEICPGDTLYMWNFDNDGKLMRKLSKEIKEVKKSGNSFIFSGTIKDCIINGAGFSRLARLFPEIPLQYKDVFIYMWNGDRGLGKNAVTTYDDEDVVRLAIE